MRKRAKQPSLATRILKFFFTSASSLAIAAGEFIVRNPVMTGGATAFLVVLSFISANALWYQPEAHNAVFFRTRADFMFQPTPRPVLPGIAVASRGNDPKASETPVQKEDADLPAARLMEDVTDDMLPALAPNADLEIARLQQRLSKLGIYKGPVDGFTGPQTREAIDRWRALQKKVGIEQAGATPVIENDASVKDDVAKAIEVAVPSPRPQSAVMKDETQAKVKPALASYQKAALPKEQAVPEKNGPISSQDIVRVQAGLKAFGNDMVPVNGETGKATQTAIREFQKLFGMPVTGKIDATLIGKMREIGLIS
ncbi:peptidoglycan-binding domain-containing protein [Brucella sp. BE17]|uniref:peptidoglycan-binding domain-containing protein n=1 Tax=Brucella sp. BE17 TaxID=3142977 RepID=UPI0031BB2710